MASATKYSDTESVLDEVIQLFSAVEDQHIIASIRQVERDTIDLSARKQAEIKDTIRALSTQNDGQRQELAAPTETAGIELLKADIAKAEAGIRRMETENSQLTEQLDGLRLAKVKLAEAKARLTASEATDVPKQRHAISLYANISNIRWDYTDEKKVKGYITSTASGGDIRSFELDPTAQSENFIINYLWDKMAV